MSEHKRRIICDDSHSDDDFQSPRLSSKSKKIRGDARRRFSGKELQAVPKKRASRPSKRKIPTFEEGESSEDLTLRRRPSPKRRKSLFTSGLIDPDTGGSAGKVQLTFEESLKKAVEKKKSEGASKPSKTLHDFFPKPKADNRSKNEGKHEVKVDDYFASSSSQKTPTGKAAISLVPETPTSSQGGDGIRLSPSSAAKSLVLDSVTKIADSFTCTGTSIKRTHGDVQKKVKHSMIKLDDSFTAGDERKTPSKKLSAELNKAKTPHKLNDSQTSADFPNSPTKKVSPRVLGSPAKKPSPSTPIQAKHNPGSSATTPMRTPGGGGASFWKFQNRTGPQALGSRPIPQGTSTCFSGETFVITGVLECIDRDDAQSLIERGGGRVTKSVSKKTTYIVVGRDPGNTKINKAATLGTKQITEDKFFELVDRGFAPSKKKGEDFPGLSSSSTVSKEHLVPSPTKIPPRYKETKKKSPVMLTDLSIMSYSTSKPPKAFLPPTGIQELWVEKYRPKFRKQLVGQNGPSSPTNRLFNWLSSWQEDYAAGLKAKAYQSAPPWASNNSSDNGSWSRAALLSGPPGTGKTSAALVVCAEIGLATIELNASDTRSKRSLKDEVAQAIGMRSLAGCLSGSDASAASLTSHVLIMDEVDGMAGNEDRGGMQELIGIIKASKVPIICLCNDRQSAKVRSLANYCLDLRFHRPRVEQIKSTVLSIACREGVDIGPGALNEIIAASNQDMRQVINSVQLWCMAGGNSTTSESAITASAAAAHKDLRLGPFEVIRKVFAVTNDAGKPMSFNEVIDLFFQDYSISPLFVQENYLGVRPLAANGKTQQTLDLMVEAAWDIAQGDIVSRVMQSSNGWSLLPTLGVFSCLRPGRLLRGPLPGGSGGVTFPSWFGKTSTQGKNARLLSELSQHMKLSTHGGATDPSSLLLDYLHPLAVRLSAPLKEGDIDSVLKCLDAYQLLREDMDNIMDLTTWQGRPGPMNNIDAKVKSTLTRSYKKASHLVPYATELVGGGKKRGKKRTEISLESREEDEANQLFGDDSEESSLEDEAEIQKMAKVKSITKAASNNGSSSTGARAPKKPQAGGRGRKKAKFI